MTVKECEDRITQLEGSLGEVRGEVSAIKAGCESMSSRLGALETQMTSFAQILSRIEANTSSGHGQTSGTKSSSLDSPQIDMPVFDGRLPYGWIARVERFFRLGQYAEEEKLELVCLCLDGAVLNWFNSEVVNVPFSDWENFKQRLLVRFTLAIDDEPGKCLLCIQQTGEIVEYINELRSSQLK
ncbi:unnamed protein product [Microthlaspi erraticum]|uniref:Retrotransposon gag domain-containing protein n=1 Tax=Microthlaspi erraticum TaxID=1685480 RepID=A0A6D2ITW1_9BRAS|nr:unnamed protein product [Microthlaspi erraticum]